MHEPGPNQKSNFETKTRPEKKQKLTKLCQKMCTVIARMRLK